MASKKTPIPSIHAAKAGMNPLVPPYSGSTVMAKGETPGVKGQSVIKSARPEFVQDKLDSKGTVMLDGFPLLSGESEPTDVLVEPPVLAVDTALPTPCVSGNLKGAGTSGDPYQIWCWADLVKVGTGIYTLDKYYKLMADIDATPSASLNSGAGWLPLGNATTNFTGGFDGNNKTISNLFINRPTTDYVGFLGYINTNNIKDLTISGDVTGQNYVGLVIGRTNYNNSLSNLNSAGEVAGVAQVGGVIGALDYTSGTFTITNCDSTANVTATGSNCGGIGGIVYRGNVTGCNYDGDIVGTSNVGGLFGTYGNSGSSIQTSTVKGTITATGSKVGGVIGTSTHFISLIGFSLNSRDLTITTSATSDYVGGLIGYLDEGNSTSYITNCTVELPLSARNYVGALGGWLKLVQISGCAINSDITGASYIGMVAGLWGWNNPTIQTTTITGTINATGSYIGGVVGQVAHTGTITGITPNITITTTATSDYVGGIVGYSDEGAADTTITNCSVTFDISGRNEVGGIGGHLRHAEITGCTVNADISGAASVGGVAGLWGWNNPTIQTTTITGTINATGSYIGGVVGQVGHTGTITGITPDITITTTATSDYVGGIIGYSDEGNAASYITNCSVTFDISGRNEVGGIGGHLRHAVITGCTVNADISGASSVGGVAGTWGWNSPTIQTTTVQGSVTGTGNYIGGYVGNIGHQGIITGPTISSSNFTLTPAATSNYVGGIVGGGGSGTRISGATVTLNITAQDYVGGIIGQQSGEGVGRIYGGSVFNGNISGRSYVGLIAGSNLCYGTDSGVQNTTVTGVLTATGNYVGVVAGQLRYSANTITFSGVTLTASATSNYVGGVAGHLVGATTITGLTVDFNVAGQDYVGGIYGGTDSNWEATIVTNCTVNATITGRSLIGGICGHNDQFSTSTKISFCTIKGTITASGNQVGGVAGAYRSEIEDITITTDLTITPSATSDYVGGIIGAIWARTTIRRCDVSTPITARDKVGGIVGGTSNGSWDNLIINDCEVNTTITGRTQVGGIIGHGDMYGGSTKISFCTIKGTIAASGTQIGGVAGAYRSEIEDITITTDLTITPSATSDYVGGIIGATWARLYLTRCVVNINITGQDGVGGILGGTNSPTGDTGTYTQCVMTGNVTGRSNVGGIAGVSDMYGVGSEISKCLMTGNVVATGTQVGGIVGYVRMNITDSYAIGSVQGSDKVGGLVGYQFTHTINRCYSKGAVTGSTNLGGLVGYKNIGTATNAFWDTETSGRSTSALGTGKTTAEMMTQATYTTFDFATPVWLQNCLNGGYPYLKDITPLPEAGGTVCGIPIDVELELPSPTVEGGIGVDVPVMEVELEAPAPMIITTAEGGSNMPIKSPIIPAVMTRPSSWCMTWRVRST